MARVCPALENPTGPAHQAVADDYDGFAEASAAETESNLIYGYYILPAIPDPAGDVAGFRIAVISEPPPAPGTREAFPEVFE